ncbi:HNH endonuclease signature motif containing protein [Micrococcoides hystricis]|uniref:HNH endonuclease signature motif containing protein n=1 Tax=Micrococcoides hystricis TaxID=1572761 RepID=A0ABV6PBQ4_9MICC
MSTPQTNVASTDDGIATTATTTDPLERASAELQALEQDRRALAAKHYRHLFDFALAYVRHSKPQTSAQQLTVPWLEEHDAGVLLRKMLAELARVTGTTDRTARQHIVAAVNLVQHGAELLNKLERGEISVPIAEAAAAQLKSIASPKKKHAPDGSAWEPGQYQEQVAEHEDAKGKLGRQLSELASTAPDDQDFRDQAAQARNEHHPQPPAQRHRRARANRYVRISSAADGMGRLEAFLSSADLTQLERKLAAATKHLRARGLSTGRTMRQLQADVFTDLLLAEDTAEDNISENQQPDSEETAPVPAAPVGLVPSQQPPTSGGTRPRISVQTHLLVTVSFEQLVALGGTVDERTLGFLKSAYPELYDRAMRNRRASRQGKKNRHRPPPPDAPDTDAHATVLGSAEPLSAPASAQAVAEAESVHIILTDPITGYPLGTGRKSRRVPQRVRELISYRDGHCRFPGCRVPADQCELDHWNDWSEGGHSGYRWMGLFCPTHHTGKTAGWWTVLAQPQLGDGVLEFSFPKTGKRTLTKPLRPLAPSAWDDYTARDEAQNPPPF